MTNVNLQIKLNIKKLKTKWFGLFVIGIYLGFVVWDLLLANASALAATAFTVDVEAIKLSGGSNPLPYTDIGRLVANLYVTLVIVSGIATFIYFAIGGFQYITSGGDKAGVEQARNKITHSLIGLAIVVGAYALTYVVQIIFGVSILGGVLWPGP